MLYWVAQSIAPGIRARCSFHVLDICNSPLDSSRWLRDRLLNCQPSLKLNLTCLHEDVVANQCEAASMDLIVSDAFLTRFNDQEKQAVLEEWLRLRKQHGWIVTTARIRHGARDVRTAERQEFATRAATESSHLDAEMQMFVRENADAYSRYIRSQPFDSEAGLRRFLKDGLGNLEHHLDFRAINDFEMVKANYGRFRIGPGTD